MNWISVKDRLPEIDPGKDQSNRLLVWLSTNDWIDAIYKDHGVWEAIDNENTYYGDLATHWCEVTGP